MRRVFKFRSARATAIAFLLVASSSDDVLVQAPTRVPVVISGKVPQVREVAVLVKIRGIVTVRVTTDGEKVVTAAPVRPVPMLDETAVEAIKTWRFVPHTPTTFETTVTYDFRYPEPVCYNMDTNTHWSLSLPLEINVNPVGRVLCEQSAMAGGEVRTLSGHLRCDCPGNRAVEGAKITARPREGGRSLQVTTGKDGAFKFPSVVPGDYFLEVDAPSFFYRGWSVRVSPANERSQLDLALEIDNKTVPPPPADANADEVPTYPDAARVAGIEGVVKLRVAPDRTVIVLEGPADLAAAALANVRTWTFQRGPTGPMDVSYRYALTPGDCDANQNARVTMKLPLDVEVVAKRPMKCGAR